MSFYWKATRPDGTDFRTGTIRYEVGQVVEHPVAKRVRDVPSTYLSVSTVATDCTGMGWPCRLFTVEGIGKPLEADGLPNKRCFSRLRVVEERPAHEVFGPQGVEVAALIERAGRLTEDETQHWDAARYAALALVVRDLITADQFDILYGPWVSAIGEGASP